MTHIFRQLLPGNFATQDAADQWLRDNPPADTDRFDYLVVTCWHGVPDQTKRRHDEHTSFRIRRLPRR